MARRRLLRRIDVTIMAAEMMPTAQNQSLFLSLGKYSGASHVKKTFDMAQLYHAKMKKPAMPWLPAETSCVVWLSGQT